MPVGNSRFNAAATPRGWPGTAAAGCRTSYSAHRSAPVPCGNDDGSGDSRRAARRRDRRAGRISLARLVELTSSNPARLFGLFPRKGTVAVGSDADVVIFDPELERSVSPSMLKSNADYSVYDGWLLRLVMQSGLSAELLSCDRAGEL